MYIGQYQYGRPEGYGQYKWSNGNTYQGMFKGGLKHGNGKWRKKPAGDGPRANCYEGDYVDDKKHGWGHFEWESGNSYSGMYIGDERQGFGEMQWTDGSVYRGTWDKGVQHGVGIMLFPNGSKRVGFFSQNEFQGPFATIGDYDEWLSEQSVGIRNAMPIEFRDET